MPLQEPAFLSYFKGDRAFVERLDDDLRKRGITARIDTRDVQPASPRRQTICNLIASSKYFIACLSPKYLDDEFSRTQLFLARAYTKRILPILAAPFPRDNVTAALLAAGQQYTHAIRGIDELDIADFTGNYAGWGLG